MEAVSASTRNLVWQGLLDVARYTRYCGVWEKRYRKKHIAVRFTLGVLAVITSLPLIPAVPMTVSSFGAVGILGLVIWDYIQDYGSKVAALRIAAEGLSNLEIRQRHLWDEVQNWELNEKEARRRNSELQIEAQNLFRGLELNRDEVLNEFCQKEAFESEKQRYASG